MRASMQAFWGISVLTVLSAAGTAAGQAPAELVLKGKVRDFVEDNPTRTPAHPHFYGNRPHGPCSAQGLGVPIAAPMLDTTDLIGDTAVFKGDHRGPRLVAPMDARAAACFEPAARFTDWFNDRPTGDVNRPFLIDIRFTRLATGVYEYRDDTFFPIDDGGAFRNLGPSGTYGHLLPAPNNTHNYGFTMELHARFTYFKGRAQVFNFMGDDDVWVFVNGKLAIELGGMHPAQTASFNLDSIAASHGLKDSLVYPLDFFFAERHTTTSMLRITTTLELEPLLSKPVITPGGWFEGQQVVTLTHPASDAVIYYTLDGSTPTTSSLKYTGPITVSGTTTVKAIAVRPGWRNSDPVSEVFSRMETVATPKANPPGRIFTSPFTVTLTTATPGAVIRFTLDGKAPDSTSQIYTGPIPITISATLKAKAFLANWVPSAILLENYTDGETLPPPVAVPGQGGFTGSVSVTLSVPGHADAAIRYTLDGSEPTASSPLYTTALVFTATTTLKARAYKQDWHPSQPMAAEYERLGMSVKAVYTDADGDGRIETAIIHLDIAVDKVPSSVRLIDPFTNAPMVAGSGQIAKSADGRTLTVSFPDKPFAQGTAFATAPLASFPNVAGFALEPFAVADSAGPVPIKAVSHNKKTPEDRASIDITFTEAIDLGGLRDAAAWPFDILRKGGTVAEEVKVASIEPVPGQANTWRWIFAVESPAWPVFIDSLTLAKAPTVKDAGGVAGVPGGRRVPVEGEPQDVKNDFRILLTNPIVPGTEEIPTVTPEIRKDPFAIVADFNGQLVCLNCKNGSETVFLGRNTIPEWVIKSKYAFHYTFTIFDHLGAFVARTSGQVDDAMMAKVAQDKEGFRSLRFRWQPVAHNGAAIATGAYILKGIVQNKVNEAQKGFQGEGQRVEAAQRGVFATFGFLRQK